MNTLHSGIFNSTDFAFLQLLVANGLERISQSAPCYATDSWCVLNEITSGPMAPPLPSTIVYSEPCRLPRSIATSTWFLAVGDNAIYTVALRVGAKQNREGAGPDMTQDTVIFPQCGKCDGFAFQDLNGLARAQIFNKNIFRSICIASFWISWISGIVNWIFACITKIL